MNSKDIEAQIHKITSDLIEVGVCVSQNYPSKTSSGGLDTVSFQGDTGVTVALKNMPYQNLYNELVKTKCYNMKLVDGGILQILYRLSKNGIQSHRLCFFPSPNLEDYKTAKETYDSDHLYGDVVRENITPFPIRFDYALDDKANRDIYHSITHMSLGEFNHCRIPVSAPLTPISFVSFIMRHFYFEDREEKINVMTDESIKFLFSETIAAKEKKVPYFNIG